MIENAKNTNNPSKFMVTTADANRKLNLIEDEQEAYLPIKGRIRQMEEGTGDQKLDLQTKQSKNEDNLKRLSSHQNGNSNGGGGGGGDYVKADDGKVAASVDEDNRDVDDVLDSNKVEAMRFGVVPTPLPRTSRTNSITNDPPSEESVSGSSSSPPSTSASASMGGAGGGCRPSPKPRVSVAAGSYKVLNVISLGMGVLWCCLHTLSFGLALILDVWSEVLLFGFEFFFVTFCRSGHLIADSITFQ